MIERATDNDKKDILHELSKEIHKNVYLYIDIYKYGVNCDFLKVWVQRKHNDLNLIAMKYYDSFQLYATDDIVDFSNVAELILLYKPSMISGHIDLIKSIYPLLNNQYAATYGYVLMHRNFSKESTDVIPQLAKETDMDEISRLICSDKSIGQHYQPEELSKQFIERFRNNMGRNFVIRKDNKIIAHYATYAEIPDVAVTGGLIVLPECRGMGYAKVLMAYLYNILLREGKKVFLFCSNDNLNVHLKFGSEICSEYGKLTLIK